MKLSIISLAFFVFSTVQAQVPNNDDPFNLPLEDLKNISVSSIDFTDRSLKDSFASAYIISKDIIKTMPMFTLGDFFEMLIPGITVFPQGTNGAGLGVRGQTQGGAKNVQAMWDGHSLNRLTADGNMSIYYSPLLNDIEQVEVVLGPGSVKHGTGALNGYVNFVPKNGTNNQGSFIEVDYGNVDDSKRLQYEYGQKYGQNRDFYFYAGYFQANGFATDNDFGGATSTLDGERNKFRNRDEITMGNYEPSYKFSLNWSHDRFNLKTLFEHMEFNPGALVTDSESLNQRTTFSFQPKYTFQLANNSSFELSSSVQLIDKSRIRRNILKPAAPAETGGRESAFELRGTYQTRYFDKHDLAIGGQVKWLDITSRKHFFSTDPGLNRSFVDGNWQEYSLFVEDNFSITDRTTLIAGIRYDAADFKDELSFDGRNLSEINFKPPDISNVSPRLALTHKTDSDYLLRAVYQEGFTYPAMFQYPLLFAINEFLESEQLETFPDRTPEVLKNFELGIRGDLIKDKLKFDLTAYYNRFESHSVFVNLRTNPNILPPQALQNFPEGMFGIQIELEDDIDVYGSEFTLTWKPNNNFISNLSYAYSVPDHITVRDNALVGVTNENRSQWLEFPRHQVKADLGFKYNKWLFTMAGVYQSGLDIDRRFAPQRENAADDYVRVNAGLSYQFNDHSSISLIVKNAFGNNTPKINGDPTRAWQGALGSDERLIYLGFSLDM